MLQISQQKIMEFYPLLFSVCYDINLNWQWDVGFVRAPQISFFTDIIFFLAQVTQKTKIFVESITTKVSGLIV